MKTIVCNSIAFFWYSPTAIVHNTPLYKSHKFDNLDVCCVVEQMLNPISNNIIGTSVLSMSVGSAPVRWLALQACCSRYHYLPYATFKKECYILVSAIFPSLLPMFVDFFCAFLTKWFQQAFLNLDLSRDRLWTILRNAFFMICSPVSTLIGYLHAAQSCYPGHVVVFVKLQKMADEGDNKMKL